MPRVLAYALSGLDGKQPKATVRSLDDMDLHDSPIANPDSFLDFDAVVLFAGSFERIAPPASLVYPQCGPVEFLEIDLDKREREFHTLIKNGRPFIFLVPGIPRSVAGGDLEHSDLFRRVLKRLRTDWGNLRGTAAPIFSNVSEFETFISKYGLARIYFKPHYELEDRVTPICGERDRCLAFELDRLIFFLPCHRPQAHEEAADMAAAAVRAVLAYRERISTAMPHWLDEFQLVRERALRSELSKCHQAIAALEAKLEPYSKWKSALCCKSDPLVEIVTNLLRDLFGLRISSEDKKIEDATILDDAGNTLAVIEIKGDTGTFKRQDVNQVDGHRERLKLPATTPGLLIMNTMMKATSLLEKDVAPHSDIIKKAVTDNVLLVRTLDLLGYADLVDQEKRPREDFLADILSNAGWLKVADGAVQIIQS
jgi:hypothetical protein